MNKLYLIAFLIISTFASCSKNASQPEQDKPVPVVESEKYKQILAQTGCKVKDAESVELLTKYTDASNNVIYLYGSRKTANKEHFWLSKYSNDGNLQWEVNLAEQDNNLQSHAYLFNKLTENKVAIFQVYKTGILDLKKVEVLILNTTNGNVTTRVDVGNYTYSRMFNLKQSFLVYNTQSDLDLDIKGGKNIIQITYEGVKLPANRELKTVPAKEDFILNDELFLSTQSGIQIKNLFDEVLWVAPVNKPVLESYTINNNQLAVIYHRLQIKDTLTFDLVSANVTYESLHIPSFTNPVVLLGEVGKEFKAVDGLTIKVTSITKSTNANGITHYRVKYTLTNRTVGSKILEGTFSMISEDKKNRLIQYGILSNLYPGESVNRVYDFEESATRPMAYLDYAQFWVSEGTEVIRWNVPAS